MQFKFDDKLQNDPAYKRVALKLKISLPEVLGRFLFVAWQCMRDRTAAKDAEDIDAIAELDGFADALLGAKAATLLGDGRVELRDLGKEVEWIRGQDDRRVQAKAAKDRIAGVPGDVPGEVPRDVPLTLLDSAPAPARTRAQAAGEKSKKNAGAAAPASPSAGGWVPRPGGPAEKVIARLKARAHPLTNIDAEIAKKIHGDPGRNIKAEPSCSDERMAWWLELHEKHLDQHDAKHAKKVPHASAPKKAARAQQPTARPKSDTQVSPKRTLAPRPGPTKAYYRIPGFDDHAAVYTVTDKIEDSAYLATIRISTGAEIETETHRLSMEHRRRTQAAYELQHLRRS